VVRGTSKGDSHGGAYLVDLDNLVVEQKLDWNTADIDWQGRGWDRGLRGIAFDGDRIFIAASDELYAYDRNFNRIDSWRCDYLKHCHEIAVFERKLFLASTAYDSILVFDLDENRFVWGLHIDLQAFRFRSTTFDPEKDGGPIRLNRLQLNNVVPTQGGLYIGGAKSGGMLHFNGEGTLMSVTLPEGNHNAQPYRDGVLYHDTNDNMIRYASRDGSEDRAINAPLYEPSDLETSKVDDPALARQGFGRGLCVISDRIIASGSSPSTIALHDVQDSKTVLSVNISMDVRNTIHGVEVWPYA
jgi:hypothetical protein